MSVVVSIAAESKAQKPAIGDILKLEIFFDEKLGSPSDSWEVVAPPSELWLPAGGVTVATMSVRSLPTDGNATKLALEAMVHQPGPITMGPLLLRNQVTKAEVEVPYSAVAETSVSASTQPKEEPPWILPPVRFGGWDWALLSLVLALLLGLGILLGRSFWRRLRSAIGGKLSHTDRALHALANLQKYSRSNKPLQLDEWKKFSFDLANILRKYADENFEMDSSDMTDRELLHELRLHEGAAPFVNLLGAILGTITEVRYGRKELDASVVPGLLLDARKFVESTAVAKAEGGPA